jgi:hypothetical protein
LLNRGRIHNTSYSSKLTNGQNKLESLSFEGLRSQSEQKIRKKIANFLKNIPKSSQVKKNIYNKAQFENPKHLQQTTFKILKYLQQIVF